MVRTSVLLQWQSARPWPPTHLFSSPHISSSSHFSPPPHPHSHPSPPPLRNTSLYPVCTGDEDCDGDKKCFQYMCYPWQTSTGFRWCSKPGDCSALMEEEGGDGNDGGCFRHHDTVNINFGICLPKSQMKRCKTHGDCPGGAAPVGKKGGYDRGSLRCTNRWCGEPQYFEALKERECSIDQDCERLLTGEMCCYDFSSPQGWQAGTDGRGWRKRCCHNPSGNPVIRPPDSISPEQLNQLDRRIGELSLLYMDMVVCEALKYPMMIKLDSCREYTTTTTTTLRPRSGQRTSGSSRILNNSQLFALLLLLYCQPSIHLPRF